MSSENATWTGIKVIWKQIMVISLVVSIFSFKTVSNAPIVEDNEVENWSEKAVVNPEELGEYFEGDIVTANLGRNGIVGETKRWKNGVIPYELSGYFSSKDKNMIKTAMDIYKKYTCISFRPKTRSDTDYISITNYQSGCWSSVGKSGGVQNVNLESPQCTTKIGTSLHELMHAVGFLHEQNRYERDDYVTINWDNIKKGQSKNFNKAAKDAANDYGVPYDFISVMHYSSTAFSSNGKRTISPKDENNLGKMGQRNGLSKGDISKINAMYNCPEVTEKLNITGEITMDKVDINNNQESNPFLQVASNLLSIIVKKFRRQR